MVDSDGLVTARVALLTRAQEGTEAVVARIVDSIRQVLASVNLSRSQVQVVVVGCPSVVDFARGVVLDARNLGWKDVPWVPGWGAS